MKHLFLLLLVLSFDVVAVPIKDNVLFAFEKCKTLVVDLEKGQLKEVLLPPFDVHCKKNSNSKSTEFNCIFYNPENNQKIKEEIFSGNSELGLAELRKSNEEKINFLIGRKFASFDSLKDHTVCIGFYLFEEEALKQKKN